VRQKLTVAWGKVKVDVLIIVLVKVFVAGVTTNKFVEVW
jgi:hypothetical protein